MDLFEFVVNPADTGMNKRQPEFFRMVRAG
jgi:hypothetical protein